MTPEAQNRVEIESQIKNDFLELQKKLNDLKNEVQVENDDSKKQKKSEEVKKLEKDLSEMKALIDTLSSLQEAELQSLKTRLESIKNAYQEYGREIVDLKNERFPMITTYELLKDSETCNRLLTIITSNPKEFKNIPGDSAEAKLEYIFQKIRQNITLFLKNKLGNSEKTDYVIKNTVAPALEWNLMELLRDQGNEANISMLKGIDDVSFNKLGKLVKGVGSFAQKATGSYNKFSQWMNALDYLSVHNGVLYNPEKSEVLTNPLKFQEYLNDVRFVGNNFSPYEKISDNIFGVDENQDFKFGMSLQEKQAILGQIGNIQVVDSPKTTALIAKMLDKPEKFLGKTEKLQETANGLLDGVNSLNSVTKMFGVDILGEISKTAEKRNFWFKILDFVCKLIGITGGLEGIVKRWRLNRMDLTDEKSENISQIFKNYKDSAGENTALSITDENSCKSALANFEVTDSQPSKTKGDFLRDSIVQNIDVSLVSPALVQQTLGNDYLKKETVVVDGHSQERILVDVAKITDNEKLILAHKHMQNMKLHLEKYADNDLQDFYSNIHSMEDLALCITASLYADKDDVIEGVKAKVFLPENYGSVRMSGEIKDNTEQASGEVSPYKLAEGEYPFKDVEPYKGIAAYDLRNVKMTPILDYSELIKKHEGVVTLSGTNITNQGDEYPSNTTLGNRSNNPCDISHSNDDIGHVSDESAADGQALAKYDTPVNGIASAMRLLRRKYSNKSITEINVGGYQGYYKANEEKGLSALRLKWITDQCRALNVGPHQMLNLEDPTTLKAFVAQIAVQETGTHLGKELLDQAYNKAFS